MFIQLQTLATIDFNSTKDRSVAEKVARLFNIRIEMAEQHVVILPLHSAHFLQIFFENILRCPIGSIKPHGYNECVRNCQEDMGFALWNDFLEGQFSWIYLVWGSSQLLWLLFLRTRCVVICVPHICAHTRLLFSIASASSCFRYKTPIVYSCCIWWLLNYRLYCMIVQW